MHGAKTVNELMEVGLEITLRDVVIGFLFAEAIVCRPADDQYVHVVPHVEDTDLFEEIFDVATTKHTPSTKFVPSCSSMPMIRTNDS